MATRIDQLLELLTTEPNDSFLNYALALEYAKLNEKFKAIGVIEKILSHDKNYLAAYYQLGQLYEQTSQLDKAHSIYLKGIEIAILQKNRKTQGELDTALMLISEQTLNFMAQKKVLYSTFF